MPHFEIFIKVNRLLKGENTIFLTLCKEIVKNSQKFQNKQGRFKINDKFAFSELFSAGIITPAEAKLKKITFAIQEYYRRDIKNFFNYFNPFFPFTFPGYKVLTAKVTAYAVQENAERSYNKYFNN